MNMLRQGARRRLVRSARGQVVGPVVAVAVGLAVAAGAPPAAAEAAASERAQESAFTAFTGARVIVGDGSDPIENATFVVEGERFVAVGPSGDVEVPAGAERVDLTGRTVIPALIDTHVHLSRTRAELIEDLRRRAYYGIGAAMSLGQDTGEDVYQVRSETIPGAARYRTAGRGITRPEPGRSDIPFWITTEDEARAAVRELAALEVDIVKIWVDDRNGRYEKLTPALYTAIIDEAHRHDLRVTAHIFTLEDAKGVLRAGVDAFAHGVRDRDVTTRIRRARPSRPHVVLVPNLPRPGRRGGPRLAGREPWSAPASSRRSRPASPTGRRRRRASPSRRATWREPRRRRACASRSARTATPAGAPTSRWPTW